MAGAFRRGRRPAPERQGGVFAGRDAAAVPVGGAGGCRIPTANAPANLATIKQIASNLMRVKRRLGRHRPRKPHLGRTVSSFMRSPWPFGSAWRTRCLDIFEWARMRVVPYLILDHLRTLTRWRTHRTCARPRPSRRPHAQSGFSDARVSGYRRDRCRSRRARARWARAR